MSEEVTVSAAPMRERIAEELRALLARRKLNASELARRIGVSQRYMSRRISGETALDVDDLEMIAKVLNVEVADLFPRQTEGRVVVIPGSPGRQTTVSKFGLAKRPTSRSRTHGQPPKSTRRPSRLSPAHSHRRPQRRMPSD